jgi:hypothetical protein
MVTIMVKPLRILDRRVQQLKNILVDQVKVQWDKYITRYATWEDAETLRGVLEYEGLCSFYH